MLAFAKQLLLWYRAWETWLQLCVFAALDECAKTTSVYIYIHQKYLRDETKTYGMSWIKHRQNIKLLTHNFSEMDSHIGVEFYTTVTL